MSNVEDLNSIRLDRIARLRETEREELDREMAGPTREEIQAQIAASEARSATAMAHLEGKIDVSTERLVGKMDALRESIADADRYNRDTRLITIGTIVAGVIAIGGLVVTMATYGDALFGRGMNVRDVIQATIKETIKATPGQ